MASVVGYSKNSINDLYDIKICRMNPYTCDIQVGYYKMINKVPESQYFSFPATQDNRHIFIPSRIVEDRNSFKTYVLNIFKSKPECIDIEPCNIYTSDLCCKKNTSTSNSETIINNGTTVVTQEDNLLQESDILWIVGITCILVILVGAMIGVVAYIGSTKTQ